MNDFQRDEQHLKQLRLSITEWEFLDELNTAICTNMHDGKTAIDDIASTMCIHSSKLRRRVKHDTGITLISYILHIRMREAIAMLMKYPKQSITDIAAECGFADHSHFTHTFKRLFGISPLQYFNDQLKDQQLQEI